MKRDPLLSLFARLAERAVRSTIRALRVRLAPSRRWRIDAADRALDRLADIEHPARKFAYLRKIDPFIFEEMILTALEWQGCGITRNKRYTGDGGIDGRAVINGEPHLIQAKRYAGHIKPRHVASFADLCRRSGSKGLFVHTGKTGPASRSASYGDTITVISGDRMLKLLAGPAADHTNT